MSNNSNPPEDFALLPSFQINTPNFADHFGIWAIHESWLKTAAEKLNGINLHAHVNAQPQRVERTDAGYMLTPEGIALFNIVGPMMKRLSSMDEGTSTIRMRQQIREADKNSDVVGGFLILDTPGGTVKGNRDLAEDVARFNQSKPLYAFIEDMTASAGVSIASQAKKRYANNGTALYGAMGTYAVLLDMSGRAEQLGVKVHVIKAGAFKGSGEPGTEITAEQLAEAQRIVNALNEGYLELIATGLDKPVELIRSMADGRVHTASDAQKMGLIDGVASFDQVYSELVKEVWGTMPDKAPSRNRNTTPRSKPMSDTPEKVAATLAELKQTFPNSTADWRESQLEKNATLSEAAIAYATHVEAKAKADKEAHEKQLAETRAEAEREAQEKIAASSASLGHDPIALNAAGEVANDDEDPAQAFEAEVVKAAGANPDFKARQRAIAQVARRNPAAHQAYLMSLDENRGAIQQRQLKEKVDLYS